MKLTTQICVRHLYAPIVWQSIVWQWWRDEGNDYSFKIDRIYGLTERSC
ncbi:MAG: hypothetical protein KME45_05545 [Stenomitos rutilans HA7619-LM2]|nr:hypothetical protein [Stenomitos rutilans HA7619-LM2]